MDHVDLSIVIVNWNTKKILYDCLNSVYSATKEIKFEIIVIDNASNDGSVEMVKSEFPDVRLITNFENRGFAAANNQGMSIAKGRYILLLNSDTIVSDQAINKVMAFADSHKDVGIAGCRVLNPDKSLQLTCFKFPSVLNMLLSCSYLYKIFPHNKFFGRERMTWWLRDDIRQVDVVTGCFMLARHKAIDEIGLMDEKYFMYGEETDWCYRFKKAGWKVMFTPDAQIIHLGGQSSSKVQIEMIIQLRLSILHFMRMHYSWLQHKIACILVILFFMVRLPFWLPISIYGVEHRKLAKAKTIAYLKGIGRVCLSLSPIFARRD